MSMSMLDPEFLNELPEDLRSEVLEFCKKRDITSDRDEKPETKDLASILVKKLATAIMPDFKCSLGMIKLKKFSL